MLPENEPRSEGSSLSSELQTNYLILRTLESRLAPDRFQRLLETVCDQIDLPKHVAWNGQLLPSSYHELRTTQASCDDTLLHSLVQAYGQKKIQNLDVSGTQSVTQYLKTQLDQEFSGNQNLFGQLHRQLAKPWDASRKVGQICTFNKFERLKTVFCHANLATDEVSSIYNVHFDQKGKFIVSAGDEGQVIPRSLMSYPLVSILKVWDRQTLTLQASLHGHADYITEIEVSKCNRYVASAGKDTTICVWELATGKLAYKLSHHAKLINCVKFFSPTSAKEPNQQYLLSCSDDGTVRLYDFTPISGWATSQQREQLSQPARSSEEDNQRVRRSQRQKVVSISTSNVSELACEDQQQQLYSIELTPDEFRPGSRNKKLDTLVLNHQGIVVAGSSSGELLVWRINYDLFNKRAPKVDYCRFLGQFKMSRQSCVKFCEFSPKNGTPNVGECLMTGSVDGTINVWNLSVGAWRSSREHSFDLEDKSRLLLTIDESRGCRQTKEVRVTDPDGTVQSEFVLEQILPVGKAKEVFKFSKSVCDAVRWSATGRFCVASVSSHFEDPPSEMCRIKVWDNVDQVFFEDLTRDSGLRLPKNTFVLATHPSVEEILLTGSERGIVALWNIHSQSLLRQFKQHGVYSVDANIMDNPVHGNWSKDGRAFILGNSLGTISLYGHENEAHQYVATRVQQFFQFDIQRQTDNPYERITNKPTICGYNMAPYEVQPERFLIRFTDIDPNFTSVDFQRNLSLAQELGQMEERYYQDKLETSLIDRNQQQGQQLNSAQQQVQSQSSSDSDSDNLPRQFRPADQQLPRNIGANRPGGGRPRAPNDRQRQQTPAVNISESDTSQNAIMRSQSQHSDSESNEDIQVDVHMQRPSRQNTRPQVRHPPTQPHNASGRPQRAARPANLRDTETIIDEDEESDRRRTRATYSGRRAQSSDTESITERAHQISRPPSAARVRANTRQPRSNDQEVYQNSFYLSDYELESEPVQKQDFTPKMLIQACKHQSAKMESHYELIKSSNQSSLKQPCALCKRTDGEVVGPFAKRNGPQIWLHKDCIEVNTYSYFSTSSKKWVNIDTMIRQLGGDAPHQYNCYRCERPGASVACTTCGKNFHGFYCAFMYLLPQARIDELKHDSSLNTQYWQCLFCQDTQNNKQSDQLKLSGGNNYTNQLKKIDSNQLTAEQSHFVRESQLAQGVTYMPQIDDVLVYFWQGHEEYCYQYNCHFYAGQSATFPASQVMPWFNTGQRQAVTSSESMLVKVVSIQTLFPSERSLSLITSYGEDQTDYVQTPQMVQRVELQFVDETLGQFYVDLFPNELPDFLVLYQLFCSQQAKYQRHQSLVGKEVTVRQKLRTQRVRVLEESPLEHTTYPYSVWNTLLCAPTQTSLELRRQQSVSDASLVRLNFWDIVFDNQTQSLVQETCAVTESEHQKLKNFFAQYLAKNKEYLIYFRERVQERIAPGYRQIIAQEMWLDLIQARINNKYYRSVRQLMCDIDQIAMNAAIYNGETHDVAVDAKEIVRRLKNEIVKLLQCHDQGKLLTHRVQDATSKLVSAAKQQQVSRSNSRGAARGEQRAVEEQQRLLAIEETKDEVTPGVGQRTQRSQVIMGRRKDVRAQQRLEDLQRDLDQIELQVSQQKVEAAESQETNGSKRVLRKRLRGDQESGRVDDLQLASSCVEQRAGEQKGQTTTEGGNNEISGSKRTLRKRQRLQ